jgi:hypothetical protein
MLKNHKCCGALFGKQNKLVFLIYTNDLIFYTKVLSSIAKLNGITPMKTHVEFAHTKVVALIKLAITKELVDASHI